MKTYLLLFFTALSALLYSCEKEKTTEEDPFADPTITSTRKFNIKVDTLGRIRSYVSSAFPSNTSANYSTYIGYSGDSIARKSISKPYPPLYSNTVTSTYYLNSMGYADSVMVITQYDHMPVVDTSKYYLYYNNDGYLLCTATTPIGCTGATNTYQNGNYVKDNDYEYYNYSAKLDLFSHAGFDNEITGKNSINLPKKKRVPDTNTEQYFYYQINADNYIASCIVKNKDIVTGDSSYLKTNYTYEFLPY